jgi:hypothetical protein
MTPRELLATARALPGQPGAATAGRWPRAAALLGRQALEAALERLWERKGVALAGCSARAQLLCLPTYLGDRAVAARAAHAWAALSQACHHHAYELAPTAAELGAWLDVVAEVVERADPPGS